MPERYDKSLEERKNRLKLTDSANTMGITDQLIGPALQIALRKALGTADSTTQQVRPTEPVITTEQDQPTLLQLLTEAYNIQIGENNLITATDTLIDDLLQLIVTSTAKVRPIQQLDPTVINEALKAKKNKLEDFLKAMQTLAERYVLIGQQCQAISRHEKKLTEEEYRHLNSLLSLVPPSERQTTILSDKYKTLIPYTTLEELGWLNKLVQHLFKIFRMFSLLKSIAPQVQPPLSR